MGRKTAFDPSVLFGPSTARTTYAKLDPYPIVDDALDAVRARKKAMYVSGFSLDSSSPNTEFARLVEMAIDRDLTVVLRNVPQFLRARVVVKGAQVFVLPIEEVWRIQALDALWESTEKRASSVLENHQSYLFGYTAEQRKAWLEWKTQTEAAWGCRTIYTLLDKAARQAVLDLGMRCFGSVSALVGREFFFNAYQPGLVDNASSLIPKQLTLARVGVLDSTAATLFGAHKTWKTTGLTKRAVTKRLAATIYDGLRSNVQFFGASGWK